jgi:hypothetical protein
MLTCSGPKSFGTRNKTGRAPRQKPILEHVLLFGNGGQRELAGLSVGEKTLNSVLMVGTSTFTAPIVRGRLPATHKVGGGQDLRSREPRDVFAAQ